MNLCLHIRSWQDSFFRMVYNLDIRMFLDWQTFTSIRLENVSRTFVQTLECSGG